jgi:predicted DNA-binding ribbon-helix-helix protein
MPLSIFRKSIALEKTDITVISKLANKKGLNFSSALRVIIREWNDALSDERVRITEAGREVLMETSEDERG